MPRPRLFEERPWGWFLGGCHPNRDTGRLIADAFKVPEPQPGEMPGTDPATGLLKPLISGVACVPLLADRAAQI